MATRPTLAPIEDRHAKLLKLLPKHKYQVAPAAREAGFSASTAHKGGKSLLLTALKRETALIEQKKKELGESTDRGTKEITGELRKTLAEQMGLSRQDVVFEFVKLLMQDRDLSTKLKALIPVLRDEGMNISDESHNKVSVPILNITVKENNMANPSPLVDEDIAPIE